MRRWGFNSPPHPTFLPPPPPPSHPTDTSVPTPPTPTEHNKPHRVIPSPPLCRRSAHPAWNFRAHTPPSTTHDVHMEVGWVGGEGQTDTEVGGGRGGVALYTTAEVHTDHTYTRKHGYLTRTQTRKTYPCLASVLPPLHRRRNLWKYGTPHAREHGCASITKNHHHVHIYIVGGLEHAFRQ